MAAAATAAAAAAESPPPIHLATVHRQRLPAPRRVEPTTDQQLEMAATAVKNSAMGRVHGETHKLRAEALRVLSLAPCTLLLGPAGIGKSALLHDLARSMSEDLNDGAPMRSPTPSLALHQQHMSHPPPTRPQHPIFGLSAAPRPIPIYIEASSPGALQRSMQNVLQHLTPQLSAALADIQGMPGAAGRRAARDTLAASARTRSSPTSADAASATPTQTGDAAAPAAPDEAMLPLLLELAGLFGETLAALAQPWVLMVDAVDEPGLTDMKPYLDTMLAALQPALDRHRPSGGAPSAYPLVVSPEALQSEAEAAEPCTGNRLLLAARQRPALGVLTELAPAEVVLPPLTLEQSRELMIHVVGEASDPDLAQALRTPSEMAAMEDLARALHGLPLYIVDCALLVAESRTALFQATSYRLAERLRAQKLLVGGHVLSGRTSQPPPSAPHKRRSLRETQQLPPVLAPLGAPAASASASAPTPASASASASASATAAKVPELTSNLFTRNPLSCADVEKEADWEPMRDLEMHARTHTPHAHTHAPAIPHVTPVPLLEGDECLPTVTLAGGVRPYDLYCAITAMRQVQLELQLCGEPDPSQPAPKSILRVLAQLGREAVPRDMFPILDHSSAITDFLHSHCWLASVELTTTAGDSLPAVRMHALRQAALRTLMERELEQRLNPDPLILESPEAAAAAAAGDAALTGSTSAMTHSHLARPTPRRADSNPMLAAIMSSSLQRSGDTPPTSAAPAPMDFSGDTQPLEEDDMETQGNNDGTDIDGMDDDMDYGDSGGHGALRGQPPKPLSPYRHRQSQRQPPAQSVARLDGRTQVMLDEVMHLHAAVCERLDDANRARAALYIDHGLALINADRDTSRLEAAAGPLTLVPSRALALRISRRAGLLDKMASAQAETLLKTVSLIRDSGCHMMAAQLLQRAMLRSDDLNLAEPLMSKSADVEPVSADDDDDMASDAAVVSGHTSVGTAGGDRAGSAGAVAGGGSGEATLTPGSSVAHAQLAASLSAALRAVISGEAAGRQNDPPAPLAASLPSDAATRQPVPALSFQQRARLTYVFSSALLSADMVVEAGRMLDAAVPAVEAELGAQHMACYEFRKARAAAQNWLKLVRLEEEARQLDHALPLPAGEGDGDREVPAAAKQLTALLVAIAEVLAELGQVDEAETVFYALLGQPTETLPTAPEPERKTLVPAPGARGALLLLPPHSPERLQALLSLARIEQQAGLLENADPTSKAALDLARELRAAEQSSTSGSLETALHRRAGIVRKLRRHREALALLDEELALVRRQHGSLHPQALAAQWEISDTLSAAGELNKSLDIDLGLLEDCRIFLGADNQQTLACLKRVAKAHARLGQNVQVVQRYMELHAICRKKLGSDSHPDTLEAMALLAGAYAMVRQHREAKKLRLTIASLLKNAAGGEETAKYFTALCNIGISCYHLGQIKEAHDYLKQAFEGHRRHLGPNHPQTRFTCRTLYSCEKAAADNRQRREDSLREAAASRGQDAPRDSAAAAAAAAAAVSAGGEGRRRMTTRLSSKRQASASSSRTPVEEHDDSGEIAEADMVLLPRTRSFVALGSEGGDEARQAVRQGSGKRLAAAAPARTRSRRSGRASEGKMRGRLSDEGTVAMEGAAMVKRRRAEARDVAEKDDDGMDDVELGQVGTEDMREEEDDEEEEPDMMSMMPMEVMIHILSHLSPKHICKLRGMSRHLDYVALTVMRIGCCAAVVNSEGMLRFLVSKKLAFSTLTLHFVSREFLARVARKAAEQASLPLGGGQSESGGAAAAAAAAAAPSKSAVPRLRTFDGQKLNREMCQLLRNSAPYLQTLNISTEESDASPNLSSTLVDAIATCKRLTAIELCVFTGFQRPRDILKLDSVRHLLIPGMRWGRTQFQELLELGSRGGGSGKGAASGGSAAAAVAAAAASSTASPATPALPPNPSLTPLFNRLETLEMNCDNIAALDLRPLRNLKTLIISSMQSPRHIVSDTLGTILTSSGVSTEACELECPQLRVLMSAPLDLVLDFPAEVKAYVYPRLGQLGPRSYSKRFWYCDPMKMGSIMRYRWASAMRLLGHLRVFEGCLLPTSFQDKNGIAAALAQVRHFPHLEALGLVVAERAEVEFAVETILPRMRRLEELYIATDRQIAMRSDEAQALVNRLCAGNPQLSNVSIIIRGRVVAHSRIGDFLPVAASAGGAAAAAAAAAVAE